MSFRKPGTGAQDRTASPSPRPTSAVPFQRTALRGQRQQDAYLDVIEICKHGFASKIEYMSREIVEEVRSEYVQAVESFKKEAKEAIQTREWPVTSKISELLEKVQLIEQRTVVQDVIPEVDLQPILAQMQKAEASQRAMNEELQERLERMSKVTDAISNSEIGMENALQRLEDQVQRLESKADSSSMELSNISTMSRTLSQAAQHIAKEIKSMQQQDSRHYSDLERSLELKLDIIAQKEDGVDEEMVHVHQDMSVWRQQQDQNFRTLFEEIASIQKALDIDFIQVPQIADQIEEETEEEPLRKRMREFYAQTDVSLMEDFTQTEEVYFEQSEALWKKSKRPPKKNRQMMKGILGGEDALRERSKAKSMDRPYSVTDFYSETGLCQAIAQNPLFENVTMAVVFLNAVWTGVTEDHNTAAVLLDADPIFLAAENIFCTYFFIELGIRFGAFQVKTDCFSDFWFRFDLFLLFIVVIETWVMTALYAATDLERKESEGIGASTMNVFKLFRLVRLLRLSRLAKIMKSVPELRVVIQGIGFASRSVAVFLVIWLMITYVFALILKQLTEGAQVGDDYFSTVPAAMNSLLLQGVFPASAAVMNEIFGDDLWYLWPVVMLFMVLVSLIVMYMLVGVLVNVVHIVSSVERESMIVQDLAQDMRFELERMDFDLSLPISKSEFETIILDPECARIMTGAGVDVKILTDMVDIIYDDAERAGHLGLKFSHFIEVLLSRRGSNPATVKDTKNQVKLIRAELQTLLQEFDRGLGRQFEEIKLAQQELREDIKDNEALITSLNERMEANMQDIKMGPAGRRAH